MGLGTPAPAVTLPLSTALLLAQALRQICLGKSCLHIPTLKLIV